MTFDYAALQRMADMHPVYRMFGASGQLLYVGVTADLATRLGSHAEKRWFPLVAEIRLEWFPDRAAAEAAERRAIQREHPKLNIVGHPGRSLRGKRPHLRELLSDEPITLREAVAAGLLSTIEAARKVAMREQWAVVGKHGQAHLYDVKVIREYRAGRRRR
jgi:predicted GIY-YIG superfamily endonuclease